MSGSVSVIKRNESLIISSYSPTDVGPLVMNDWIAVVPSTTRDDELGSLGLQALEAAKDEIPYPPLTELGPKSPQMKRLYELAGIRSFKQYMTGSTSISLNRSDDQLAVTAKENLGPSGGFRRLDFVILLDTWAPVEVGRAIRRALEHAI